MEKIKNLSDELEQCFHYLFTGSLRFIFHIIIQMKKSEPLFEVAQ